MMRIASPAPTVFFAMAPAGTSSMTFSSTAFGNGVFLLDVFPANGEPVHCRVISRADYPAQQ